MIASLILLAALSATPDAELRAQGFTLENVSAEGVRTWSRPLTTMRCGSGCSTGGCSTQMECGQGGCGTQQGCSSGSCGISQRGRMGGNPVPKLVPIEKDDEPAAPSTPPAPIAKAEPVDTDKIAAAIVEKMASDPRFKGPKGEPGERGPQGPAGPAGKDGKPGEVNIDELAAAVILRLPPVKLNLYDDVDNDGVMSESEVFRLSAPLGEPLKIEVTGGIKAGGK